VPEIQTFEKAAIIRILPELQFLARFHRHILPGSFVKDCYYGFLQPRNRKIS